MKVVVEVGHAFPLRTAAAAKAMLAFLSEEVRKSLIGGIHFNKHTRTTITSARAFAAKLVDVREKGYALDCNEESET